MVEYKIVLRDWPASIPAPGTPSFQINKLDTHFVADTYRGWRFQTNTNPIPYFSGWGKGENSVCIYSVYVTYVYN